MERTKIVEFSAYFEAKRRAERVEVRSLAAPPRVIPFDVASRRRGEVGLRHEESKCRVYFEAAEVRRRIAGGDYRLDPEAIAMSILDRLLPVEVDTSELPRFSPDRS